MLIAGLTIVAGWLRDWLAALAIIMASFAVQAVISIPQLMATRRLNGLPPLRRTTRTRSQWSQVG